jgi:hypothetical protein
MSPSATRAEASADQCPDGSPLHLSVCPSGPPTHSTTPDVISSEEFGPALQGPS